MEVIANNYRNLIRSWGLYVVTVCSVAPGLRQQSRIRGRSERAGDKRHDDVISCSVDNVDNYPRRIGITNHSLWSALCMTRMMILIVKNKLTISLSDKGGPVIVEIKEQSFQERVNSGLHGSKMACRVPSPTVII